MSKPVFEDLFAFSGRRNRKSYNLYLVALSVFGFVSELMAASGESVLAVISILVELALVVSGTAVGAQRFRDFGWTGWSVLVPYGLVLFLVPAIAFDWVISGTLTVAAIFAAGLALMVVPGTQGSNRYGPDPLG